MSEREIFRESDFLRERLSERVIVHFRGSKKNAFPTDGRTDGRTDLKIVSWRVGSIITGGNHSSLHPNCKFMEAVDSDTETGVVREALATGRKNVNVR